MSSKLLLVARSICSSRAELAEDDHQLIMLTNGGVAGASESRGCVR